MTHGAVAPGAAALVRLFRRAAAAAAVAILLVSRIVAGPAEARVIVVSPSPGGAVVQAALDRARPGDTVRLRPGVYRERVCMERSGVYGRPITLLGEPGAVLDGSEPTELSWREAPDVAPGVYRASVNFPVFTVVVDGKIVTMLRADRVDPARATDPKWGWPTLFREGVGPSRWAGVKGLALYLPEKRELLLRLREGRDPREAVVRVAPMEPVVQISADRCVVRGLSLRNAAHGVLIEDSVGSVVERCRIGPVDNGVWLGAGADRCTVRFNEIFMDPYAGADPKGVGAWDNWQAHKVGGHYDRYGVQIYQTVGGHEIHDNDIHDVWDGIEDRGGPGENRGLRIHHNRIRVVSDDGLEPNGAEEDCRWHDNWVERAICGFRIKAPTVGPLYAYRNLFFDNGEDFRNYGEVELKPAVVYVYHNTCTARAAVVSNQVFGIGTPNYHYLNNLFWCDTWWQNTGASVLPNWRGDHNVYVRRGADARWEEGKSLAARLGLDAHSLWAEGDPGFRDFEARDVSLTADSPARGRGVDLSRYLGRPLPGCEPGYFRGEAPDAGAVPHGRAMPRLPRRPGDVRVPVAGTWPGPEAGPSRSSDSRILDGLARGLEGWEEPARSVYRIQGGDADQRRYLRVDARSARGDLRRRIGGLSPGKAYLLAYRSRRNTIADLRVIVRDPATGRYLAQGGASSSAGWRRSVLRFTPLGEAVTLEISPRSPGVCEIDGLTLHQSQPVR